MGNRAKTRSTGLAMRIRDARTSAGLTQRGLAIRLKKAESTVRSWELGKSEPDIKTAVELADLLSVSLDQLLRE